MSYYTGPLEEALIPLRLMVAGRLDPGADAEPHARELQRVADAGGSQFTLSLEGLSLLMLFAWFKN
jgi:hypothetical protein